MTFLALTFPKRIGMGAQRSADWATTVNTTAGGWAQRNINRSRALHAWDIGFAVRTAADYEAIVQHFHEARGQAHSFPFWDKLDHSATATQGLCALVSGSVYQLYKRYGSTNAFDRKITRPRTGTLTVWRTRSAVTTVITPAVNYSTGQITVSGHLAGDVYTWAGDFDVPCRYAADSLPGLIVDRNPGPGGLPLVQCESILIAEDME